MKKKLINCLLTGFISILSIGSTTVFANNTHDTFVTNEPYATIDNIEDYSQSTWYKELYTFTADELQPGQQIPSAEIFNFSDFERMGMYRKGTVLPSNQHLEVWLIRWDGPLNESRHIYTFDGDGITFGIDMPVHNINNTYRLAIRSPETNTEPITNINFDIILY